MRKNAKAVLLVIGLFVLFVALNFAFFADNRASEEDEISGDRSSYRTTPYGTRAFYTLLEESQYGVMRWEKPYTELKEREPATLIVIAPPEQYNPDEEEITALANWLDGGGLLIIVDREIKLGLGDAKIDTEAAAVQGDVHPLQPTTFTRGVHRVAVSEYATAVKVDSRSVTYHIGDTRSAILADARVGKGRVILLTDQYIVANNGISQADNVNLVLNLLSGRPPGKIGFDEYHHGYGHSWAGGGMMSYFRGTPVPWMMAQGALIAVLVVYSYGKRFGRPIPLRRERRTTNLEFVSSMANITRLAEASDLAMEDIYSEFRKRLCRFSGVSPKVENSKLAASAARRSRVDQRGLGELLSRCDEISTGNPVSDGELLKLVTRIRDIESELNL
jgi:Domain of unknown function (DUF4350)